MPKYRKEKIHDSCGIQPSSEVNQIYQIPWKFVGDYWRFRWDSLYLLQN